MRQLCDINLHYKLKGFAFLSVPANEELNQNPSESCSSKSTCKECIQASVDCAWCSADGYGEEHSRCDLHLSVIKSGCPKDAIVFPTSKFQVTEARNFSDQDSRGDAVQLQPNKVVMQLRPKDSKKIELSFREALDYPVDLYYLMDLSKSMEDDKEKLAVLGTKLAEEMQKLTKNFRLGFGSFVDKTVMPYISTIPAK